MDDATTPPRLIPLAAMAHILGVTVRWLREEAEAGRIPCLRAGDRLLVDRLKVEEILVDRAGTLPSEARR